MSRTDYIKYTLFDKKDNINKLSENQIKFLDKEAIKTIEYIFDKNIYNISNITYIEDFNKLIISYWSKDEKTISAISGYSIDVPYDKLKFFQRKDKILKLQSLKTT